MKLAYCLIFLFLSPSSYALSAKDILLKVDRLYRSRSSAGEITMIVQTPHWTREMRLKTWSRGMDDTLIRILSPKKDRGVATLRKKREMWNFFPKINKVIKVPPSMMMGSWMGSDFTNDDLVRQTDLTEEYQVSLQTKAGNHELTLVPKENTATVWGKMVILAQVKTLLPLRYDYYDEKGALVRKMVFSEIKKFDGIAMPSVLEMIPLKKKNHKTLIRYDSLRFNLKHEDKLFTLRNLKKH